MIKDGLGGAKTCLAGLKFEKMTDLRTAFNSIKDYFVDGNKLLTKEKLLLNCIKDWLVFSLCLVCVNYI
jgi:hypothetical protein